VLIASICLLQTSIMHALSIQLMYNFGILSIVIFFSMHHNKLETVWGWKNATVWPYYVMNVTVQSHCSPYREVRMTVCCLGS